MKTFIKASIILLVLLLFISCKSKQNSKSFEAMNTFMVITSYGDKCKLANDKAENQIKNLEALISTTNSESLVYKINNSNGEIVNINETLLNLIEFGIKGAEETNGHFTPLLYPVTKTWGFTTNEYRVPSYEEIQEKLILCDCTKVDIYKDCIGGEIRIEPGMAFDFGAIGKGFAGDEAIKVLQELGIESAILDLGGNIQVLGKKPDGSDWKIGLKDPFGGSVPIGLSVSDCAVITSGGYERFFTGDDGKKYIHIFDGKTGYPVNNNVVSSTIVTKNGLYGDYLSTSTFILGKDETVKFWKEKKDFDFIMMFDDNSLIYSIGLQNKITILKDFSNVEIIK